MTMDYAYKHLRVSYTIKTVNFLHLDVLATLVAILSELPYTGYIAKTSRTIADVK
jgi:hypothetical protein